MINIYITNLHEYNNGYLVGKWVELPSKDIQKELESIGIGRPGSDGYTCEEYFITDYEAPFEIDEYENIYKLNDIAQAIEDLDEYEQKGVLAYIQNGEEISHAIELAEVGDYMVHDVTSMEDIAYNYVEECYDIPDFAKRYFDYEQFARDLEFDGNFIHLENCIVELY